MIMQDKLEKERNDAKNAVEEYVYEMRDKLSGEYEKFVSEDDRNSFTLKLEDTENWLYEDGEDQPKQVYVDKLAELKNLGQPIKMRFQESEERPKLFEELGKQIQQYMKVISSFKNKVHFFFSYCYFVPPHSLSEMVLLMVCLVRNHFTEEQGI
ncbi:heat shock 70 kDa protein 4-like, partial [Mustela nigripes]|uniref:heat shock 70 kDa protein 4-like n=1 Tax=Mustela nigripes TaxID=77151 RepID=UPI002815284D